MTAVLLIDVVVILSLVIASRRRLEDCLPVFCFFAVLIPNESKLVISGGFDLGTTRVSLLTLLTLFFIRGRHMYRQPLPLKRLMVLHIAWALLSTCYSLSVMTSAKQVIAQVVEYYLLYYIIVRTISDVETMYQILYAMVLAIGVCCIFGIVEVCASYSVIRIFPSEVWTTYDSRHDPLYIEWGRGLRIRSTFPHPILFGDALAMCSPLALYLLSVWKQPRQRFALLICTGLMYWAVYKTFSRGPWIAIALSSMLLFVMVKNRIRTYLMGAAVLSLLVLGLRPGVWQTISDLAEATLNPSSVAGQSYQFREAVNKAVKRALAKDPARAALGYGLGTFRELGLEVEHLNDTRRWITCDDHWTLFMYETGYAGFVLITILLFKPLLMGLRSYLLLPRPARDFSGVVFISLASFYFLLMSVAGYNWGQQGFMAWILIALSVAYPRLIVRDGFGKAAATARVRNGDEWYPAAANQHVPGQVSAVSG
jgi:hypothetical protein